MAGHSQFKNIMHRKGRQDAVRSKMFSKLAREITVAAKLGMPDPAINPRLRLAIHNAKAVSMPKDNIERAINKAAGGDAENYEEIRYEGYGPGGVAVIVEALTDNRNRTASNVRTAFTKAGGAMGETGSVVLHVRPRRRDRLSGEGRQRRRGHGSGHRGRRRRRARATKTATASSAPSRPRRGLEGARKRARRAESVKLIWKPQNTVPVDEERAQSLMKLVATLEDDDDVQNVYANFEVDDETMAKLSAA